MEPAADLVQVMVVDDQAPFRDAARAVIARVPGFELVAEATSGEEAVDLVDQVRPGVVLMDINMGVMDGLEATKLITTAHPETMVILVSTYTEADMPPTANARFRSVCARTRRTPAGTQTRTARSRPRPTESDSHSCRRCFSEPGQVPLPIDSMPARSYSPCRSYSPPRLLR